MCVPVREADRTSAAVDVSWAATAAAGGVASTTGGQGAKRVEGSGGESKAGALSTVSRSSTSIVRTLSLSILRVLHLGFPAYVSQDKASILGRSCHCQARANKVQGGLGPWVIRSANDASADERWIILILYLCPDRYRRGFK